MPQGFTVKLMLLIDILQVDVDQGQQPQPAGGLGSRRPIRQVGDPEALAYVAWSAVHGLASLVIEGQIEANTNVDELIRQTTRTLLDGMLVRRRAGA